MMISASVVKAPPP